MAGRGIDAIGGSVRVRELSLLAGCTFVFLFLFFHAPATMADIELWPKSATYPGASLLPTSSKNSLLDPSKLNISHQLTFSYSSSSGVGGNTGGLWLTNFQYRFSQPLTVDVAVGSSLTHSSLQGLQGQSLFLESFSLRYRPNENFYFHLLYREAPRGHFLFPTRRPY